MRRAIVSSTATVSGIVLLLGLKSHAGATSHSPQSFSIGSDSGAASSPSGAAPSKGSTSSGGAAPSTGSTSKAPAAPAAPSSSAAAPAATSKVVTGDAADTRYGPVQLQVTFVGKKITKINVVQYPAESGRDREINSYALPVLNQEAMAAQSAQIDVVSGATYTTDGYTQSLQSAIDKAGA